MPPEPSKRLCICAVKLLFGLSMAGCVEIPDQSQFAPLPELTQEDEPAVRLYASPIPRIENIAIHSWLVTYDPEDGAVDRWELWQEPDVGGISYGHVHNNLFSPEAGLGSGEPFVIAELIGAEARAVIEFIEQESPFYPCMDVFFLLGPNSNTYLQWVLDSTGWDAELPASAIGKNTSADCDPTAP